MKWEVVEDVTETGTYRYEVEADSYDEAIAKVNSGDGGIPEREMDVTQSQINSCERSDYANNETEE